MNLVALAVIAAIAVTGVVAVVYAVSPTTSSCLERRRRLRRGSAADS
jgi:hypothetical protein